MKSKLYKYPRTYHLPWSPGQSSDDKVLQDTSHFEGKLVDVMVKMDGENITMYPDYIHARSIDSRDHESRHWVKRLHNQIRHDIPEGWRICGENVFAEHSIPYENLPSYFLVFSIWNEQNMCLTWRETGEWVGLLGLCKVRKIATLPWDHKIEERLNSIQDTFVNEEGYVVRVRETFHYDNFSRCVAKWVRKGHVQTDTHWMHRNLVVNKLA